MMNNEPDARKQVEPFQRGLKTLTTDLMINGRRRDHGPTPEIRNPNADPETSSITSQSVDCFGPTPETPNAATQNQNPRG
jgi:hypothetical protein